MAFDGLDINISASAADATSTIASVKTSLGSLERSANDADDSMEELGDSTSSTAAKMAGLGTVAGSTAVSLTGLSTAGTGASASMTALGVSVGTAATAITGLAAVAAPLVATLGAVGAAASGLAAGFSAVVGSGVLAFGEERAQQNERELRQINARIAELERLESTEEGLTAAQANELDQLEEKADKVEETTTVTGALAGVVGDLREEIQPLVVDLGREFVPLIEAAVDAIPRLVESIIDALGPLEPFRDALRQFGAAAMEAIPNLTAALLDLGREALPVLGDLIRRFGEASDGLLDSFVQISERIGDDLMQLGGAISDVLPDLTELGVIIIEGVTPHLDSLLGHVEAAIETFNRFVRSGDAAAIMRALRQEIVPLIPRVKALAAEFRPLFNELVDELPNIIEGLGAVGDTLLDIGEAVAPVVVPALTKIVDLIGSAGSYFADWVEASEESEADLASDIESLRRTYDRTLGRIRRAFGRLRRRVSGVVGNIRQRLRGIATWVRSGWSLASAAGAVFGALLAEAESLKTSLVGEGGVLPSIFRDFASWVQSTATTLLSNAFDTIRSQLSNNGLVSLLSSIIDEASEAIETLQELTTISVTVPGFGGGGGSGGSGGSGGAGATPPPEGGPGEDYDSFVAFNDAIDAGNESAITQARADAVASTNSQISSIDVSGDSVAITYDSGRTQEKDVGGYEVPDAVPGYGGGGDDDGGGGGVTDPGDDESPASPTIGDGGAGGVSDPRGDPSVGDGVSGLATGGLIKSAGAAILHAGERVVPAAQVGDRGPAPVQGGVTIESLTVQASGRAEGRAAGRALKQELKRFDI
jgi:hypothetical protein